MLLLYLSNDNISEATSVLFTTLHVFDIHLNYYYYFLKHDNLRYGQQSCY